jgi:cytoskeletal protein RodZ
MTAREPTRLGEVLRAAREARFIDLSRVERDTKIRARYLSALERGEYRELPGAVYTRGFLRNYGIYLGLDPEYLLDLYRLEQGDADRRPAPMPPRPVSERQGRPLVVSSGAVAAVILTVMVALFVVYLGGEFITFARTPELRITDPAGDLAAYDGDRYTIRGQTEPNATVRVDGLQENPSVTADADGAFSVTVRLVPGANVVTLVAHDPVTGRDSAPVRRSIRTSASGPSPSPASSVAIDSPVAGSSVEPGGVALSGSAPPGSSLLVSATRTAALPAGFGIVALGGLGVPLPEQPATAATDQISVDAAGRWSALIPLGPGEWEVTAALAGAAQESAVLPLSVVSATGLRGTLTLSATSYLEVDEDGVPKAGISGSQLPAGTVIELSSDATLRIRVGNAGAVELVVNGVDLGPMGADGAVVEWLVSRVG